MKQQQHDFFGSTSVAKSLKIILNGSTSGYSGGDLHMMRVAQQWTKAGWRIDVFLPRRSSREIREQFSECSKIIDVPDPLRRGSAENGRSTLYMAGLYLARIVTSSIWPPRKRYKVTIAASHFIFDLVPTLFTKTELRVTYWHHVAQREKRGLARERLVYMSEVMSAWIVRKFNILIFTGSQHTVTQLRELGVGPGQIVLSANGPSLRLGKNTGFFRDQNITQSYRKSILYMGRLTVLKGALDILRVFPQIHSEDVNSCLRLVGPLSKAEELVKVQLDLLPDYEKGVVEILGYLTEDEKAKIFKEAHVLVVPSYEEGWSITAGDGLIAGCWVIVYDLPEVRDAYPTGLVFVEPGDLQGLSREILRCLRQPRPNNPISNGHLWSDIARAEMSAIEQRLG